MAKFLGPRTIPLARSLWTKVKYKFLSRFSLNLVLRDWRIAVSAMSKEFIADVKSDFLLFSFFSSIDNPKL